MENQKDSKTYVTNNYYAPSTHIDNHDGGVVHIGGGDRTEISKFHFPAAFPMAEGVRMYEYLRLHGFLPKDVDLDCFLYVMGCFPQRPPVFHPLVWNTTRQQLRTLLEHAYEPLLSAGAITKKALEDVVPNCFVGKDGCPYSLSKPRTELSADMDTIMAFFRRGESEG